jgi:hypothetical protein
MVGVQLSHTVGEGDFEHWASVSKGKPRGAGFEPAGLMLATSVVFAAPARRTRWTSMHG